MAAPLANIRVLDMSRVLAGPWAGQLLGDFGADVVKLERPASGDDTRHWGPPWLGDGESAYFLSTNRNKRSLCADVSTDDGQALVRELACNVDVLIENFRHGTAAGFGIGPDDLLGLNPKLIYCSISAFGKSSSRATEPGYDAMIQASAGLMSVTGPPDTENGEPQKVGVAVSDIMAGMYASTAILAALNARSVTGVGQSIEVPLYDSQVAWLANQNLNFLLGGETPARMGTAHPNLVPYQVFATRDGRLMLAVGNDRQFVECCKIMGLSELAIDPRFEKMRDRLQNRNALVAKLAARFCERKTGDWLHAFRQCGVPAGPVNTIADVLTDEYASERSLVRHLENGNGETVPIVANPVDFSATPVHYDRAPPLLGEHTDEVLREWLGYSDARILALKQKNVI